MTHPLVIVTLLFVLPLCTADSMMQLDGESSVFRIILKRLGDLEENVRKSDRKLEEIPVLKRRLDDAERRSSHMQHLQYRLENSEEKTYELENLVKKEKNTDASQDSSRSSTVSISESNVTKEDKAVDSISGNASVLSSASTPMFRQAEKSGNVEIFPSFQHRIQRAIIKEEKTKRRSIVTKVAFTALFFNAPIQLMPGRSLVFDRVDYNEGNAYDKTSGIMTCPISGTYFFYTNVLATTTGLGVVTELVHEGNSKGRTYVFGGSNYDQGGITAIIYCRTGERVWVRTVYGSQIHGEDYSSFSGFILWIDADASSSN